MTQIRNAIRFVLNGEDVTLDAVPATQTLLDYLRLSKRLRGTKEGCAEGDCGACTVLVGTLTGDTLSYESVNACIRFTASLDASHVVTVEHLSAANGELHPVQQAMVDHHGSQCGFCTPGIVMSLYGMWMGEPHPGERLVEAALHGHLCRCTGYAPIIRAGKAISSYGNVATDPLVAERETMKARLMALRDGARIDVGQGAERFIVPADVDDLAEVYAANPNGTIVAGATDVGLWVTKFMREIGPVIFTAHLDELHAITESADGLTLGAGATYTEARNAVVARFPQMDELWHRIGGGQVRNMGTVGGNIANGSPIGDTPPALIALGARIVLRKGSARRTVLLQDYFVAYGTQDRSPGEFVESVFIPNVPDGEDFAVYKISKRRDEDISALCGAFRVRLEDGIVASAVIAFGGMAATPKRAAAVEAAITGRAWDSACVDAGIAAVAEDFQPISDMRASAEYRMLTAQNLLRRFHLETTGQGQRLKRGAA